MTYEKRDDYFMDSFRSIFANTASNTSTTKLWQIPYISQIPSKSLSFDTYASFFSSVLVVVSFERGFALGNHTKPNGANLTLA